MARRLTGLNMKDQLAAVLLAFTPDELEIMHRVLREQKVAEFDTDDDALNCYTVFRKIDAAHRLPERDIQPLMDEVFGE